jgi:hypothetical protein
MWEIRDSSSEKSDRTLGQDSYGRPGLSLTTSTGAVQHGMKEICVQRLDDTPVALCQTKEWDKAGKFSSASQQCITTVYGACVRRAAHMKMCSLV